MTDKKEALEDIIGSKKDINALGEDKSQTNERRKIFNLGESELNNEKEQEKRREEKRREEKRREEKRREKIVSRGGRRQQKSTIMKMALMKKKN